MYTVKYPTQFKKDLQLAKKRKLDLELLHEVMDKIEALKEIPAKFGIGLIIMMIWMLSDDNPG